MSNAQMQLLLIEDNKGDARLLQELLKETSYAKWELDWKVTLQAGLQELEKHYFDLIFLDLTLPDSHGLGTVSSIISQAPDIPVIVMTGNNDDVIAKAAVSAGAQDYLIKGEVDARILQRSINYAIERNKLFKDRVQAEEALHESQEQALLLADLLEQSSQPFAVRFLDGRLNIFNDAFCQLVGYTKEELIDFNATKLTPPEWLERENIFLDELKETGQTVHYEKEYIRKDGSRIPVEALVHVIKDDSGQPLQYYAFITDISERKKMADTIREHDIRLEKLASQAPGMLFQFMRRLDGSYCVPFTTDAIINIFGCSPQDVADDFSPIAKVILPEDLDRVILSIEDSAEHLTLWQCEYRVHVPGQQIRWLWGSSMPEKLENGSIIWHGYNVDISDRKQAEEEIRFRSTLLDSAIDSVFVHDEDGNFYYVNETAYKTRGYTREELMAINLNQLDMPEYAELIKIHMNDLKSTRGVTFESAHFRKDGTIMPVEVHAGFTSIQGREMIFSVVRDITERKQADTILKNTLMELKEERDKAQQYLDIAGTILVALDVDANITLLNKTGCKLLNVRQENALGMNWFDNFIPSEEKESIRAYHEAIMTGMERGDSDSHEDQVISTTGVKRDISWQNTILKDQDGKIVGTLSSGEDITDRIIAERMVLDQYTTLVGIMESSNNPVFSVDTNYCYTSFNKIHAATMKALYSADIELGKCILDYQTVEEDRVTAKINLDRALHGERLVEEAYSGEEELTRSFFEVSHNPIKDAEGNIVGVAITARDMTAIRNAQLKIENLARFPAENPNAVLRVSKDGSLLYANPGSEILLKTWDCTVGEKVPAFVKTEMDIAWASENIHENEMTSNDHFFSIVFVPVIDQEYVNLYARDITELRNAQQSLVRLNAELEARVEERTRALKEAQEKMMRQEKLAAIGKLAGSVGHELRNPLGVITNSIYYLGLKLPKIDDKIKRHLSIIQEESARANKIISELLDFARTKNNETIAVDINSLIKQTLERTQKPDNITVTTCLSESLPTVLIDPGKMEQVFQNIIVNAFQAMPDGGELEIRDTCNDDMIEIAFKDTGVGISPENFHRLFEPLFSTKVKGIGLGLSIAKDIVEQFKGTIEVKSEVGVGSTFLVKFPVGEQDKKLEIAEAEKKDC